MNLSQALAFLAYGAARHLFSSSRLTWSTVNEWIIANSNRDRYGQGYAMSRLPNSKTQAFAELRKEPLKGMGFRVVASIVFDANQGPVASHTWEVKKLDSKLEKVFGRNLRVRINV